MAESDALSVYFSTRGLEHRVLNARHDQREAALVVQAGGVGQITVTTNMAGRGTDIPLAAAVAARGGLHIISCQSNAAQRLDRQLAGRGARQGDAGSVECIVSLDAANLQRTLLLQFRLSE